MEELISWDNLKAVLEEYAIKLRNTYQDNLIKNDRIASGDLLNSVEYIVKSDNISISVSLQLANYWKYIEWDTKPHFPPMNKIAEWIKIKPVIPVPDRNGKLPTEKQLSYLIARKISEEGTEGTQDLHKALEVVNEEYRDKISDAIGKDVMKGFNVIFSEFFHKN